MKRDSAIPGEDLERTPDERRLRVYCKANSPYHQKHGRFDLFTLKQIQQGREWTVNGHQNPKMTLANPGGWRPDPLVYLKGNDVVPSVTPLRDVLPEDLFAEEGVPDASIRVALEWCWRVTDDDGQVVILRNRADPSYEQRPLRASDLGLRAKLDRKCPCGSHLRLPMDRLQAGLDKIADAGETQVPVGILRRLADGLV